MLAIVAQAAPSTVVQAAHTGSILAVSASHIGGRALIASGGAEPREGTKASPRLSCDFVVRELCEQAAEWRAAQPAPPNPE